MASLFAKMTLSVAFVYVWIKEQKEESSVVSDSTGQDLSVLFSKPYHFIQTKSEDFGLMYAQQKNLDWSSLFKFARELRECPRART